MYFHTCPQFNGLLYISIYNNLIYIIIYMIYIIKTEFIVSDKRVNFFLISLLGF